MTSDYQRVIACQKEAETIYLSAVTSGMLTVSKLSNNENLCLELATSNKALKRILIIVKLIGLNP